MFNFKFKFKFKKENYCASSALLKKRGRPSLLNVADTESVFKIQCPTVCDHEFVYTHSIPFNILHLREFCSPGSGGSKTYSCYKR
jgi:hypothetical protein